MCNLMIVLAGILVSYFSFLALKDCWRASAEFNKEGFVPDNWEPDYCECPDCKEEFSNRSELQRLNDKRELWEKERKNNANAVLERLVYFIFFMVITISAFNNLKIWE